MPGQSQPVQSLEEKIRLIQQQLVLMLHAYKCLNKEQNGESANCVFDHCRVMRDVLEHLNVCTAGESCQERDCWSSRQIIEHGRSCSGLHCIVCIPVKKCLNNVPGTSIQPTDNVMGNLASLLSDVCLHTP